MAHDMNMNQNVFVDCSMFSTKTEEMEADEDGSRLGLGLDDEMIPHDLLDTSSHSRDFPSFESQGSSAKTEEAFGSTSTINFVPELVGMDKDKDFMIGGGGSESLRFYTEEDYGLLPKPKSYTSFKKNVQDQLAKYKVEEFRPFSETLKEFAEECFKLQKKAMDKTAIEIEEQQREREEVKREIADLVELKQKLDETKKLIVEAERAAQIEIDEAKANAAKWQKALKVSEQKLQQAEANRKKAAQNIKKVKNQLVLTEQAMDHLNEWFENHGVEVLMVDDEAKGSPATGSPAPISSETSPLVLQFSGILSNDPQQKFGVEFLSLKLPEGHFKVKNLYPPFDEAYALVQEVNQTQDFIKFIVECKKHWNLAHKSGTGSRSGSTSSSGSGSTKTPDNGNPHPSTGNPSLNVSHRSLFSTPPDDNENQVLEESTAGVH